MYPVSSWILIKRCWFGKRGGVCLWRHHTVYCLFSQISVVRLFFFFWPWSNLRGLYSFLFGPNYHCLALNEFFKVYTAANLCDVTVVTSQTVLTSSIVFSAKFLWADFFWSMSRFKGYVQRPFGPFWLWADLRTLYSDLYGPNLIFFNQIDNPVLISDVTDKSWRQHTRLM